MRPRLGFVVLLGEFAAPIGYGCAGPPDLPDGAVLRAHLEAAGVQQGCSERDYAVADGAVSVTDDPGMVVVVADGWMLCTARRLTVPEGLLRGGPLGGFESPAVRDDLESPARRSAPPRLGAECVEPRSEKRHDGDDSQDGSGSGSWTDLGSITGPVRDPTPQPATPTGSSGRQAAPLVVPPPPPQGE